MSYSGLFFKASSAVALVLGVSSSPAFGQAAYPNGVRSSQGYNYVDARTPQNEDCELRNRDGNCATNDEIRAELDRRRQSDNRDTRDTGYQRDTRYQGNVYGETNRYSRDYGSPQRNFLTACEGPQWSNRWGQQADQYVRGLINRNDFTRIFDSFGSPYARAQARRLSECRAYAEYNRIADQYGGPENIPPEQLRRLDAIIYRATVVGPSREAERQGRQVWRRGQEEAADALSRVLGF